MITKAGGGTRIQEAKSELEKKFEDSHSYHPRRFKDAVALKWMEVQIMAGSS